MTAMRLSSFHSETKTYYKMEFDQNVKILAGEDWATHSEEFLTRLENMDGIRLPGQRRFKNRLSDGPREINAELVDTIRGLM